jgi:thioredoxin reductase
MYDVIIIGAGPGGMAAAAAAAEASLKILVVTKNIYEPKSEQEILGFFSLKNLAKKFQQLVKNNLIEVKDKTEIINLEKNIVSFSAEAKNGSLYYAKNVVIATGKSSLEFDAITQKMQNGKIKIDGDQKSSMPGVFAIGESCGNFSKNALVEIGEGVKSILVLLNR